MAIRPLVLGAERSLEARQPGRPCAAPAAPGPAARSPADVPHLGPRLDLEWAVAQRIGSTPSRASASSPASCSELTGRHDLTGPPQPRLLGVALEPGLEQPTAEKTPGRGGTRTRRSELASDRDGMDRATAAKCDEREVARVPAALDHTDLIARIMLALASSGRHTPRRGGQPEPVSDLPLESARRGPGTGASCRRAARWVQVAEAAGSRP